jgi:tryptophan 2,3-dioxygenase
MERFVFYPDNCCITCNDLYNHSQPNGQKPTTTEKGASVMKREIAANFVRAEKVNSATWQVTYPAETKNWDFRTMREKLFSGPGRYDQARKFRSEAVNMLCREENE